jgi:leader peptidase (prepilin peptidase) / N-methyltransferase
MAALLAVVMVLGLVVGSFLNVVIYRLPRGESLLRPGSHCPACKKLIRNRHNIPVLGWLVRKGRCAECGALISARYPLVELLTGVVFVAVTLRLGQLNLLSALPAYLYFAAIGIALALIDFDCRRLPNAIVLPSYPVVAILLTLAATWQKDWAALSRAAVGAAGLFALFIALAFAYPRGMGLGDVKLAGILGGLLAYCSWPALVLGAFGGFLLGSVAGLAIIVSRRGNRKTALPFGPFMIGGAQAAILAGPSILNLYFRTLTGT